MKPSTRWVLALVSVWAAATAMVVTGQQPAGAPAAAAQKSEQQLLFERYQRGERVMNASCSAVGCHTIRPIQTAAMDEASWSKTISTMLEKGAKLDPSDVPVLTDYLVR